MITFQYQRRSIPDGDWQIVSIIQCHPGDVSKALQYIVGDDPDGRLKRTRMSVAQACTDADGPLPLKVLAKGVPELGSE